MHRFFLLLKSEINFFKAAPAVHLIALLQPTLMYLLMTVVMVIPTFDMRVVEPTTPQGIELLSAMEEVQSPIGPDYINPIIVDNADPGFKQVVEVSMVEDKPTAIQRYGYIDSNLVKNLRNRLTAALLVMWNSHLGEQGVRIIEHPWIFKDISYTVYFGMAMIPLAAYLAAAMIGGYMLAQEFENGTIVIYQLSPTPFWLVLSVKITWLVLAGIAAGSNLYICLGLATGVWSSSYLAVIVIILPVIIIAACIGLIAGMVTKSPLPSFLIALASAFVFWLIGSGFGLAAGFSTLFERISRLIPNTPVIEMLFPFFYYGRQVAANPLTAKLQLAAYSLLMLLAVTVLYQRVVLKGRN